MSDYRRKANNGMNTTEQTAAQWAVDGRVFDVNCVLVPTDGPDQGKHKLADGIHIYNDLNFVEDGGGGGATFTPFIYLTSGSVTAAYRKQGTLNGKDWFVKVGSTATEEYPENSVLWTDGGDGWGWYISTDSAIVLYSSTEDVATPDLVETWVADGGTGALPSVAYYGETSQEGMEALAAATSAPTIEIVVQQSSTDAPVALGIRKVNTNVNVSFGREEEGLFYLTAPGFITMNCLMQISANEENRSAYIYRDSDDVAFFGDSTYMDNGAFSITLKKL